VAELILVRRFQTLSEAPHSMKYLILISTIGVSLSFTSLTAAGSSDIEREFSQLKAQHKRALTQAVEPINRRYQASLEPLLRRATQAADLDTALKIQNELKAIQSGDLRAALDDSKWEWVRPGVKETVQFFKDGTLKHQLFPGTWELVDSRSIRVKAAWGESTLRFNEDFTTFEAVGGLPGSQGVKGTRAVSQ
jgi:hypothetical protein